MVVQEHKKPWNNTCAVQPHLQNFAKLCILYFTLRMVMLVLRPQRSGDKDTQLDSEVIIVPLGVLKRDMKPLKKKFHRETLSKYGSQGCWTKRSRLCFCNSNISSFNLCWTSKQEAGMLFPLLPHFVSPLCSFLKLPMHSHMLRCWYSRTVSCPDFLVLVSFETNVQGQLETFLRQDSVCWPHLEPWRPRSRIFKEQILKSVLIPKPTQPKWDLLVSVKMLESEGRRKMWLTVEVFLFAGQLFKDIKISHIKAGISWPVQNSLISCCFN